MSEQTKKPEKRFNHRVRAAIAGTALAAAGLAIPVKFLAGNNGEVPVHIDTPAVEYNEQSAKLPNTDASSMTVERDSDGNLRFSGPDGDAVLAPATHADAANGGETQLR